MLLNHILSTSLITHCNTTIILIHLLLNVQLPIESTYNGAAETSKNGTTKTTLKGGEGEKEECWILEKKLNSLQTLFTRIVGFMHDYDYNYRIGFFPKSNIPPSPLLPFQCCFRCSIF